ncbi:MAG: DUF4252 domain-containing protein [Chitinophagales bacterium]
MKRIVSAFALALLCGAAMAQTSTFDQLYDKYAGKEGFTSVEVSQKLFALAASAVSDDPELQTLVDGLKGVRVLVFENEEGNANSKMYYKEFTAAIPNGKFDELMKVHSEETQVVLLGKMAGENVLDEMILLCEDDGEFVMVNIIGRIDMANISKIADFNIDGLDELKKLEDASDDN